MTLAIRQVEDPEAAAETRRRIAARAWEITEARGQIDLTSPITSTGAPRRKPGKLTEPRQNHCECGATVTNPRSHQCRTCYLRALRLR